MSRELFRHTPVTDERTASLTVDPETRADSKVPRELYAKFAEHLGWNVNHGMDAQLLYNPTFGDWKFPAGTAHSPNGGQLWESDPDERAAQIEEFAGILDLPASEPLEDAYADAGPFWWMRTGDEDAVQFSPDTGPTGDRAQRITVDEVSADSPAGIGQWIYLPLQRTDTYELTVRARAKRATTVTVAVVTTDDDGGFDEQLASAEIEVGPEWSTTEATLSIPDASDLVDDDLYGISVTVEEPANLVLDRLLLYPDDHVDYADPEIVELLRESDLPLLRWPGGNFVSGYDWTDGVGPRDERPTKPNPAWGGLEYNLFGTAEFVEFCENVGCEPMICVNAGDGTPEEAAKWVEYCNGDPEETEMGALRAEHGYEEPFDITYWEIGNELWGQWQVNWTIPEGNADRYERFREVMLEADPDIEVQACGSRVHYDGTWNDVLLEEAGDTVRCVTDHVLAGGPIDSETDSDELFHAFMGFPDQLGEQYRDLREAMREVGIENPRLAITELQLFPDFGGEREEERRLAAAWHYSKGIPDWLTAPTKKSISEALYTSSVIHECIRMGEFAEMVTHSALVNHGGGLQKRKERVWADPIHYGHEMGIELAGGTPVAVDVECETISTDETFGQIDAVDDVPAVDAVAVFDEDESELKMMLVHRSSTSGPIDLTLDVSEVATSVTADRTTLAADTMAAQNTYENPENVTPTTSSVSIEDGQATVTLEPYSLTRIDVPIDGT